MAETARRLSQDRSEALALEALAWVRVLDAATERVRASRDGAYVADDLGTEVELPM